MDKQDAVDPGLPLSAGPPPTFASAFPMIASLAITVEIRAEGIAQHKPPRIREFTLDYPPGPYVRCPNESSCGGGYPIVEIIRDMVSARDTSREKWGSCRGQCTGCFKAIIKITYKEERSA
jgi:hypothetical protein